MEQDPPKSVSSSSTPEVVHRTWYRTTLFNAFVVGGVGFFAPGLWNAMNSLGAGGAESPYLVNAANALVFALMGFLCIFGGPIANKIGLKWTLILGAMGFPIYSASLYTNNRYGNEWFVLVGAVFCGLSAGLFWASEGALALGYPEPSKRGRYMNIWLWFRTGGPILGGAIVLGKNHSASGKGKIDAKTYLIFVGLQCVAVPMALALTPPSKVQRGDGSPVKFVHAGSWKNEFRELWKVVMRKEVLLLLPAFWASYFNQYNSNFEVYYFGVRGRALAALVIQFANLFASTIISQFLDWTRISAKKRIIYSFYYVIAVHILSWVYAWVVQEQYTSMDTKPVYDWTDKGYVKALFVLILWQWCQQSFQNWLYYLVSTMADNISELSRLSGILRGQESFSQAVSWGLNTKEWYGGRVPMAVNTILLGLAVVPSWLVIQGHTPIEHDRNETITSPRPANDEEKAIENYNISEKDTESY